MGGFAAFVALAADLVLSILTRNGNVPQNADAAAPTYRVYGPDGVMANGTGSATFKDTGAITGATNANPIVITSAGHGLSNGTRVTITGVGGNTAANTTAVVANKTTDTFELAGVSGNGAYTSGGTWNATGLYKATISCTANNGYEAGQAYSLVWNATVNSTAQSDIINFVVT